MFLKNEWVNNENKEEIERYLETNENCLLYTSDAADERK